MNQPLISCIVPVYNGERYLRETLDSIFAQTHRPLEVIVVDDGSIDGTAAAMIDYGERVHYLWQTNAGQTSARNRGLSVAQGEFVAFLDADDLWHPQKLARQMIRFTERPEMDLCFTRFQNFWMPELAEEEQHYQLHSPAKPSSAWSISTLLTRRVTFEKFGRFADDGSPKPRNMIWFLRAAEDQAEIEVLPEVLMYRRFHRGNRSRRDRNEFIDSFFPILKEWRDYQQRRKTGKPLPRNITGRNERMG
jgi:glycosyltransferase involved in cell wall biosynthesis